jgi:hypothetical protein
MTQVIQKRHQTKIVLGSIVLLTAVALWWLTLQPSEEGQSVLLGDAAQALESQYDMEASPAPAKSAPIRTAPFSETGRASDRVTVEVLVVAADGASPAAGVPVRLTVLRRECEAENEFGVTDVAGRWTLDVMPECRIAAQTCGGVESRFELIDGSQPHVEVRVQLASDMLVRGKVLDEAGSPVAAMTVYVHSVGEPGFPCGQTDSDGGFAVLGPRRGSRICAHDRTTGSTDVYTVDGAELQSPILHLRRSGSLTVNVITDHGLRVHDADVWLNVTDEPSSHGGDWISFNRHGGLLYCRYLAGTIKYRAFSSTLSASVGEIQIRPDTTTVANIVMQSTGRLEGEVRTEDGSVLPNVEIAAALPQAHHAVFTFTDAQGRFALATDRGLITVRALLPGCDLERKVEVEEHGRVEFLVPAGVVQTRRVRLTDGAGSGLQGWSVYATDGSGNRRTTLRAKTESDGVALLRGAWGRLRTVSAYPDYMNPAVFPAVATVEAGSDVSDVLLTANVHEWGTVRGSFHDTFRGIAEMRLKDPPGRISFRVSGESMESPKVPPGSYDIALIADGIRTELGAVEVPNGGPLDIGLIPSPCSGSLIVDLSGPPAVLEGVVIRLASRSAGAKDLHYAGSSWPVSIPCGAWTVDVLGPSVQRIRSSVSIRAGECTRLVLNIAAARPVRVRCVFPSPADMAGVSMTMSERVRGDRILETINPSHDSNEVSWKGCLLPGRWQVDVHCADGRSNSREFEVDGLLYEPKVLVITMPPSWPAEGIPVEFDFDGYADGRRLGYVLFAVQRRRDGAEFRSMAFLNRDGLRVTRVLPPGHYSLRVRTERDAMSAPRQFLVEQGTLPRVVY